MSAEPNQLNPASPMVADRIGFARLAKMAFDGVDLYPLRQRLMERLADGTASAGDGLDLSLLAQLGGDKQLGLAIQDEILAVQQLYRSTRQVAAPALRVLALAAAIDMGGNTPIEFLIEDEHIDLNTLYVVPGADALSALPEHDVAIVVASDSEECRFALDEIGAMAARWPEPLLNRPDRIGNLDRDKLCRLLDDVPGLHIPATAAVSRAELAAVAAGTAPIAALAPTMRFPLIVRPRGSHAGSGLARIADPGELGPYLEEHPHETFFVSNFIDYASADGNYRKYRIVFVDGTAFAVHMAIADRWDIWYLNAGMSHSDAKRQEEAAFMQHFDTDFAQRHREAFAGLVERVGLDYFTIDCAEDPEGRLLIFEADNTAVVHNMDSPALFPYKPPQMQRIFAAFAAMLRRHATKGAAAP